MSESSTHFTMTIVSAFISHNKCDPGEMNDLIQNVGTKLVELETGVIEPEPAAAPEPAVSIKKSITKDALICLACGKGFKTLKRHVFAEHGMTIAEYRAHWSLPDSYPSTAPGYSETRSGLAISRGLGRKPVDDAQAKLELAPEPPKPSKAAERSKVIEEAPKAKASAKAKAAPAAEKKVRSFTKADQTRKKAPYDRDKDFQDDQEAV